MEIGSGSASGSGRSSKSKKSKEKEKYQRHGGSGHSSSESESINSLQRRTNHLPPHLPPPPSVHSMQNIQNTDYTNLPLPLPGLCTDQQLCSLRQKHLLDCVMCSSCCILDLFISK